MGFRGPVYYKYNEHPPPPPQRKKKNIYIYIVLLVIITAPILYIRPEMKAGTKLPTAKDFCARRLKDSTESSGPQGFRALGKEG